MLLTLVVRYSSVPVTSTGRGDGGAGPSGRRRPDVTFADRTAVRRLGCRLEERGPGVVVKASATGPLSPVPTTRRARGDERTATAAAT
jgi:hypothetical protein